MRKLLIEMLFVGLTVVQTMAQTCNTGDQNASRSKSQYEQLRDLLASQSAELQATREQLRQLQQRMELLEIKFRGQDNDVPAKEIAFAIHGPDARNPDPSVAAVAWPGDRPIKETRIADVPSTGHEGKSDSIELANGKVRIGTVLYADYAYYAKTGFGPQFTSQINPPGPHNNGYNTFEVTRAYINLLYSPNNTVTFRLTPDLYRQIGAAPATSIGRVTAIAPNTDQGLPFRLKYAYVDFNSLFAGNKAFKNDKLTIGQQQDPVSEWEERLYGFRYVNIVPWDYLGYSSSWAGISVHGPIEFNNKMYLDYSIGVYNNAPYRLLEQSEKKQAAARLTVYPFGARSDYDGLGFTAFYNFGYTNVTPDSGVNIPLYRISALAHYTFKRNAYANFRPAATFFPAATSFPAVRRRMNTALQ